MTYTVGQVARVSGVTVRTLHHYDEIKLLSPGGRTGAGYRLYAEADLERLERILFYRELGFALMRSGPSWTTRRSMQPRTCGPGIGCSGSGSHACRQ